MRLPCPASTRGANHRGRFCSEQVALPEDYGDVAHSVGGLAMGLVYQDPGSCVAFRDCNGQSTPGECALDAARLMG
jgi:hypothetical protein